MSVIRRSRNSQPADWVGKCTKCGMWRTREHTIVNRTRGERYCIFDGGLIHEGCGYCNRTGKINGKPCIKCNGIGMVKQ